MGTEGHVLEQSQMEIIWKQALNPLSIEKS